MIMEINNITGSSQQNRVASTPEVKVEDRTVQAAEEKKQELVHTEVVSKEQLEHLVSLYNDFMEPVRTNLKFELHERLERYYVSVIDSETDEVIKEIPPKKLLDMYAEMAAFMGILVDEKI